MPVPTTVTTIAGAAAHWPNWNQDDRDRAAAVLATIPTPVYQGAWRSTERESIRVEFEGRAVLFLDAGRLMFPPAGHQYAPADARQHEDGVHLYVPLSRHRGYVERSTSSASDVVPCATCHMVHPAAADCWE